MGTPSQGTGMKISTTVPTSRKAYRRQENDEVFGQEVLENTYLNVDHIYSHQDK